tara:strand:+ start:94 stop:1251 length:1158 start_codon:yes stop_codon:yes gene_type:complete
LRDFEKELEDILINDPLDLLKVKPKVSAITSDEMLVQSFVEIQEFYSTHKRPPEESTDIKERQLWMRLSHIKNDYEKCMALKEHDTWGLLDKVKEIETIDDVLDSDPLGILSSDVDDEPDIFTHNFTKTMSEREKADFVSRRKRSKDFDKFESMFKTIHQDLVAQRRKTLKFHLNHLEKGNFFIHNGMLLLLNNYNDLQRDKTRMYDGRTHVIFENGTESNMLYQSLRKILEKDGKSVSALNLNFNAIEIGDNATGYIYILKSLSDNPEIRALDNLYKIGYTSNTVAERIKNAKSDPTYLMADVESIAEFKTFNVNPQKLEDLIHTFFNRVKLDIKIKDDNGNIKSPNEWYIVPLSIIKKAIELIISGEVTNHRYDYLNKRIVKC